jgi:hypothetical protein
LRGRGPCLARGFGQLWSAPGPLSSTVSRGRLRSHYPAQLPVESLQVLGQPLDSVDSQRLTKMETEYFAIWESHLHDRIHHGHAHVALALPTAGALLSESDSPALIDAHRAWLWRMTQSVVSGTVAMSPSPAVCSVLGHFHGVKPAPPTALCQLSKHSTYLCPGTPEQRWMSCFPGVRPPRSLTVRSKPIGSRRLNRFFETRSLPPT